MIRIAICDDSKLTLNKLEKIISCHFKNYTENFEIHLFYNGITLLTQHQLQPFNVIFIDVDLPSISGFEVAKAIRSMHSDSYIIFITNNSEYVFESFNFQPFHFIRKKCEIPLETSVSDVVIRLIHHMRQFERISLKSQDGIKITSYIREIVYIESEGHYLNFYIANRLQPIKMRGVLTECEKKYTGHNFVRIHKRYLINLKYLTFIDIKNDEILLGSINKRLALSRNYKKEINEKYTQYLNSST